MSVHGFVKIVEFWLLKLQHEGKNKRNEHEVEKVSEILFQCLTQSYCLEFDAV